MPNARLALSAPRAAALVSALAALAAPLAAGCSYHRRAVVEETTVPVAAAPAPTSGGTATYSGEVTLNLSGLASVMGTPGAGVAVSAPSCAPGAAEACNGLDDNCDGRIDEGCGWASGQIQVTLSWASGADIDLYVYDPTGYRIYYADRASPSGGVLDHDARGACVGGSDTIENVYWSSPTPPRGTYTVETHYWGDCGVAGPTPVTVSVSVGGRVIGVYQVTLYPDQRVPVTTFSL